MQIGLLMLAAAICVVPVLYPSPSLPLPFLVACPPMALFLRCPSLRLPAFAVTPRLIRLKGAGPDARMPAKRKRGAGDAKAVFGMTVPTGFQAYAAVIALGFAGVAAARVHTHTQTHARPTDLRQCPEKESSESATKKTKKEGLSERRLKQYSVSSKPGKFFARNWPFT